MRSSTPIRVGGLALAGVVIASTAVIYAAHGDSSPVDRISLASAKRGMVSAYVSAAGNTVDNGVRDLAFGSEGIVEKVYVKAGDKVRKGDVLARVDDMIAREDYDAAKAALAAAEESLDNVRNGATTAGAATGSGTTASGTTGSGTTASGTTGSGATAMPVGSRTSAGASPSPTCVPTPTPSGTAKPTSSPIPQASGGNGHKASVSMVAYRGDDHGGEPSPSPSPSPTRKHHPSQAPTPQITISISIPPAAPTPTPSASSTGKPSGNCASGGNKQGEGQGQGQQQGQGGQSAQGRGGRGQGGGSGGAAGGGSGGGGGGAPLTEAQAEADVSKATTGLADAKEALAGVKIKAPADGTILSVAGTAGSRYTTGTFITLGDLDDLQVQAMFTQSDIRFLKAGQKATVTLATGPGEEYAGTVTHIDPTATTTNRLVRYGVTIALDNHPARLFLGQSATVRVTTGEAADALYVPAQAVRTLGDGSTAVTVTNGGGQVRRSVKIGLRGDRYVEILDGLSEGDQVVLTASATTGGFPDEGFPGSQ